MLIALTVITGLMAGIYAAFSIFIMRSLASLDVLPAANAMIAINKTIVKTLFAPLFFGSVVLYAVALINTRFDPLPQGTILLVTAAALYIVGMFIVTMKGNVPMNNRLQALANAPPQLRQYWPVYRQQWTKLNHIRTLCCTLACALLCYQL